MTGVLKKMATEKISIQNLDKAAEILNSKFLMRKEGSVNVTTTGHTEDRKIRKGSEPLTLCEWMAR